MPINYYNPGFIETKVYCSNAIAGLNLAVNPAGAAPGNFVFEYQPASNQIFRLGGIDIVATGAGNIGLPINFFTQAAPLVNGVRVQRIRQGVPVLDQLITNNIGLIATVGATFENKSLGNESVLLASTGTLNENPEAEFVIDGTKGDLYRVTVQDNLTFMSFFVYGLRGALRTIV